MSQSNGPNILQHSPFISNVDPTFWHKLMQLKLDVDKLNELERTIWGTYSIADPPGLTSALCVDCSSFNSEFEPSKTLVGAYGVILNKNTLESFKKAEKMALLTKQGAKLWNSITSGEAFKNPTLLMRFFVLTYADLKKYHFYYWFAFPALNTATINVLKHPQTLDKVFSKEQRLALSTVYMSITDWTQRSAFAIYVAGNVVNFLPLRELEPELLKLSGWSGTDGVYLVVGDPFSGTGNSGWPARNVLTMLTYHCPELVGHGMRLLCMRLTLTKGSEPRWLSDSSLLVVVSLSPLSTVESESLRWVGWERNQAGRFGPRHANLSLTMDPKRMAATSVDLNLKLMKWRLVPELNLDLIQNTKCLLLGAGTLGCSVARTLLGWGVHNITFVDNGCVSYSNPVRQSLFTHEDCIDGGKLKAKAAAEALKRIFPGVNSSGVDITIPMPGHPIGESLLRETLTHLKLLEELVEQHDAIFLLTDSRESRWLPTLLGTSKRKFVICAALGFDTFLVMRHGVRSSEDAGDSAMEDNSSCNSSIQGQNLGCYFCNDVTAPGNSQMDRTLDQMCTVTRPGLSAIAGGLAVELLVSMLQHPLRGHAPADCNSSETGDELNEPSPLGLVPHSVRGFLSQFRQMMPASPKFSHCIACSHRVVQEYRKSSTEFLLNVCNCLNYLEDITGLTQLHKDSENATILEFSESDSDSELVELE